MGTHALSGDARFEWGRAILQRVGCLQTFHMRELAIGMLALAKAMYGVELVAMGEKDLMRLEQTAVRAPWGPARVSWAREVLSSMLVPGQCASLVCTCSMFTCCGWRNKHAR